MNQILAQLKIWSCSNNLGINTSKTKAVLFRPKNKPANDNLHLVYGDTEIGLVNHIKILGVTFSSNMLWNEHINSVLKQLSRVVGMVQRCKTVLPYNVKLLLYKSLFYSHLTYCFLVWGTTTYTNLQKLYLMEKKYIRILSNLPYDAHTRGLFEQAGILPVHNLYAFKLTVAIRREVKENRHFFT